MPNRSPWIHELDKKRRRISLSQNIEIDVAIVGAGIAGVATAFHILNHTSLKVVIIEGDKLAHGATGHNAGQITSYFERPFRDIVAEFGLKMACEGQKDIESGWKLIDEMYAKAGLNIPFSRFRGFAGFSTKEQILGHLENNYLRQEGGLKSLKVEILDSLNFLSGISSRYNGLYSLVSRREIAKRLKTRDSQYLAISPSEKGVINSALFSEGLVSYLERTYPERFNLYEHTPVVKVLLKDDLSIIDATKYTVKCKTVILCTNGFENFNIIAPSGLSIDTRFHHSINGVVAFMAGYFEPHSDASEALSYFRNSDTALTDNPGDPYFYVTRRPFEYELHGDSDLISVGGPDFALEDKAEYDRNLEFSENARKQITTFIRETYGRQHDPEYNFMWHGIMGYTHNFLRMIGPDPEYSYLFYNLGCNGVGILPSIFGAEKVARQIAGEKFLPSIFDVKSRS